VAATPAPAAAPPAANAAASVAFSKSLSWRFLDIVLFLESKVGINGSHLQYERWVFALTFVLMFALTSAMHEMMVL
jgi:hypothetical protein